MKNYFVAAFAVMLSSGVAAADGQHFVGPKDCQVAFETKGRQVDATWTGPCKEGFAEGEGEMAMTVSGRLAFTYKGSMRRGLYHGLGYGVDVINNIQYEGYYVDDMREGFGILVDSIGNRYDGHWKASRRHGAGKQVYVLGGSYDGQWQDDKYHGKGTIVYAGGRRAEYQFDNGRWADGPPPAPEKSAPHELKERDAPTGTMIKRAVATGGPLPFDLGSAQMSAEQKRVVSAMYPLMDPADEPPYPLKGTLTVVRAMSDQAYRMGARGNLKLLVKIGADGTAQSVTAIGAPGAEMTKFATHLVMLDKYKPATCAGKPCEMIFPYSLLFGNSH